MLTEDIVFWWHIGMVTGLHRYGSGLVRIAQTTLRLWKCPSHGSNEPMLTGWQEAGHKPHFQSARCAAPHLT